MTRGAAKDAAEAFVDSRRLIPDLLGPRWSTPLRPTQVEVIKESDAKPPVAIPVAPEPVASVVQPEGNEESVRREILQRVNGMAGYEFEQLVARVLDGAGLRNAQVVGRPGDEGVDILADLYSPFLTAKVAVQVKRHGGNVGPKDIAYLRDRWVRRVDMLLFVTTSDFTTGAREVAADDKPVALVNGVQLVRIMFEHNLGVRVRPMVMYELEEEFFTG